MKDYTPHVATAPAVPGGAYDIVGDVHGCWAELVHLLAKAGWVIGAYDETAKTPITASHPHGRHLVFVGDLTDRGEASHLVLRLALGMLAQGVAHWVIGNHDWKLARYLLGNKVSVQSSLQLTLDQIAPLGDAFGEQVCRTILALPYQLKLPMPAGHSREGDGFLTVVHGAAPDHHLDGGQKNSFHRAIYGYATDHHEDGTVTRANWALQYTRNRWVVYGHEVHRSVAVHNCVIAIDTGCVFGGTLTLYRADTCDFISVPAAKNYSGMDRNFV